MKLQAAKLLLAYADTMGFRVQITTGAKPNDVTIDVINPEHRRLLLEYAKRTYSARNVEVSKERSMRLL